jgi:hypothetical protein
MRAPVVLKTLGVFALLVLSDVLHATFLIARRVDWNSIVRSFGHVGWSEILGYIVIICMVASASMLVTHRRKQGAAQLGLACIIGVAVLGLLRRAVHTLVTIT